MASSVGEDPPVLTLCLWVNDCVGAWDEACRVYPSIAARQESIKSFLATLVLHLAHFKQVSTIQNVQKSSPIRLPMPIYACATPMIHDTQLVLTLRAHRIAVHMPTNPDR